MKPHWKNFKNTWTTNEKNRAIRDAMPFFAINFKTALTNYTIIIFKGLINVDKLQNSELNFFVSLG